jgi:hypothetical protein
LFVPKNGCRIIRADKFSYRFIYRHTNNPAAKEYRKIREFSASPLGGRGLLREWQGFATPDLPILQNTASTLVPYF